jgi:hypothetical protein
LGTFNLIPATVDLAVLFFFHAGRKISEEKTTPSYRFDECRNKTPDRRIGTVGFGKTVS